MNVACRTLFSLLLVGAMAIPSLAADPEKKKDAPKKDPGAAFAEQMLKQFAKAELNAEQTEKIRKICFEHGAKIAEAQAKATGVLTAEQKKARTDAMAKAKADGVKGKDAVAAVQAAIKLTDDQAKAMKDAETHLKECQAVCKKACEEVLTADQKTKLAPPKKPAEKKPAEKKPAEKKPAEKKPAEEKKAEEKK